MTALESPIVGLTFRVRELGRLRMGQKVPTRNNKTRPEKLETFRLTSTDWRLILRASELYGGKPERWDDAPNKRQFQVTVEADRIPVRIPDDLNWSQAMEAWTAAKCIRRCNGEAMESGEPCQCREDMEQGRPAICDPYTRVNFILPELPGWGFWRLESHGWDTAHEFIPTVVLAARVAPRETYFLRLDPRTKKGEENGKPVTFQYHVPVLDTDRTPAELFSRQAGQPAIEPSYPVPEAPPGPGSDPTSEAGEREPVTAGAPGPRSRSGPDADRHDPASDPNAAEAGPRGTDATQAGREPPEPAAPTSPEPASLGSRGRRAGRSGPPAAPAEPAQGELDGGS